ncbi:uncharacterized protein LOC123669670 [Melitaea cinxia]|uniref:uncharacterized protein LOC123669670 n=1 Tax=Melitaea cinxia TaxID=113334 RepID=UPI001E273EA7|nr:uncharacterized protein LOC123669670 [Melitaea cinxia]
MGVGGKRKMNYTSNFSLIEVTRAQMMAVRRDCNIDMEQLNDDLDMLEKWCRSQDQLVEALPYLGRDMLERFLIQAKGSLERTKQGIDKALAVRGMIPDIMLNEKTITNLDKFCNLFDNVLITSLPKANPEDGTRVILLRLMNENFEDLDLIECAKFGTFGAYKFKVKGIHVINAPSFFDKLFFIAKGFFPEKMVKRIRVHGSYEELYEVISKEILPKEYGGEGMSCSRLVEEWKNYIRSDDGQRIMENSHRLVSDVSKRNLFKFDEEYFGLPGSFKKINID